MRILVLSLSRTAQDARHFASRISYRRLALCAGVLNLIALALLGGTGPSAQAANRTWSGATSNGMSTGTNWDVLPVNNDGFIFTSATGVGGLNLNNNLTSGAFNLAGITYNAGAAAFVIGDGTGSLNVGNTFVLTGNVINNGANLQTINNPFSMAADRTFTGSGDISLGGTVTITGASTRFLKTGTGTLTINGTISAGATGEHVGTTQGTLRFGANNLLVGTPRLFLGGGGSALVDLNGTTQTVGSIIFNESSGNNNASLTTGAGTLTITGIASTNGSASIGGALQSDYAKSISGNINLNGAQIGINNYYNLANKELGLMTISAVMSNGSIKIVNAGSAPILFSGANTYAGGTTLENAPANMDFRIGIGNVGSVGAITSSAIGTGTLTFNGGGISSDGVTARTILNPVAFTGAAGGFVGSATNNGLITFADSLNTNTNAHTLTLRSNVQFDGAVTGTGYIVTAGTGTTLTLNNATNTSTGGILAGGTTTVLYNANDYLSNTGYLGAAGGGLMNLNGNSDTVGRVLFEAGSAGQTSTLTTGAGTLTINGSAGGNADISAISTAAQAKSLTGNLNLNGGTKTVTNMGGLLNISAIITNGGLNVDTSGGGTVAPFTLSGANTFALGTTLGDGGTLQIGVGSVGSVGAITSSAVGTGTLTFAGGGISSDGATARTILNPITFTGNGNVGSATNNGFLTFSDDANLGGATRTITVNSDAQFDGILSNGGLTKAGTATLTLTGNETYTGATTVNAGKLVLSGINPFATGDITVNSTGIVQFNTTSSINGGAHNVLNRDVTLNGGGTAVFGPSFGGGIADVQTAMANRIVAASQGAIAADNYAGSNFDFSTPGLTAASFGAVGNVTYTGTLTPNGTVYRLGGGGGTLVFTPGSYINTNSLVINGNSNTGIVDFGGLSKSFLAVTFSGGTTQNGTLTSGFGFTFSGGTVTATLNGAGGHTATANTTLNAVNTMSGNLSITGGSLTAINPGSLGTSAVTLNGGNLILSNDGTGNGLGNSKLENISYGNNVTVAVNNSSITVSRVTNGVGTLNAANKTLQLGTLAIGTQTFITANNNGYGLEFSGTTTLDGATASTFNVTNASVSTAVPGLTLNGVASSINTSATNGATILTKQGLGTLLLKGNNTSFGGNGGATGQIINITDGYLAADSDAALGVTGATGNVVQISTNNATRGFLATESFSTSRVFRLNNTNNAIDAAQGKTLTLNTPFGLSAVTNGLQKNDVGTLEINANNSTMTTGNFVVAQGILKVSDANALGAAGSTANGFTQVGNIVPASIHLNGVSIGEYFKIGSYGTQNEGALVAVGGTSTITGTLDVTNDGSFGAASGATLNINGTFPVAAGSALNIVGPGTVNVNSTLGTTTNGLNIFGPGTVSFTTNAVSAYNRQFNVRGGMGVTLQGTQAIRVNSGAGINGTLDVNGSTVTFDNSLNAISNRLGGSTMANNNPSLGRANLNFIGGSTATETFGNLTINSGLTTMTTSGANAANILRFNSQSTRNVGGVVNVSSSGSSSVQFASAPGLSDSILNGWFVGNDFATHGGNNTPIVAFAAYTTGDLGTAVTNNVTNFSLSGGQTNVTTSKTVNVLKLTGGLGVTINPTATLTLDAGGLINDGGGNISGGFLTPSAEFIANYATNGTIGSVISGGQALTKTGAGNLTLAGIKTYTGQTTVNQGILTLAGGVNTLNANRTMVLNGGTLDLGANSQYIGNFTSNTTAGLGYGGTGGTVTGTNGTLTTNAANGTFAGDIGGSLNFVKAGGNTLTLTNANSTTGRIAVMGGELSLRDSGALANTTGGITISGGTLRLDNGSAVNVSRDVADRLNDSAAITMDGGALIYQGRIGYNSTESVGAVTANTGANVISAIAGGTGVNSAQLTLASLTRSTGAEIEINRGTGTNLGLIGNSPRVVVTAGLTGNLTPVNGVVPGVFSSTNTDNYHFVGYAPGMGFGILGTAGFPTTTTNFATAGATDNVYDPAAGTAVVSANKTINSLRKANLIFTNGNTTGGADLLTIGSGMAIIHSSGDNWGTAAARGRITSGTQELFIMHQDGNSTPDPIINSVITDNGNPVSLIVHTPRADRGFYVWLTAPNTYSGGTYVNGGSQAFGNSLGGIDLNATTPGTIVIPAGGLTINNNGLVDMSNNAGQIHSSNVVTINGGGQLNLMGSNTLAGIAFNSNGGSNTPTVGIYGTIGTPPSNGQASRSGTGTLTITGNISSTPSNVAVTPVISIGNLDFGGSTAHDITVEPLYVAPPATPAALPDKFGLNISAIVQNGGFTKKGLGYLQLSGNNSYTGGTTISAGTVVAQAANNLPSGGDLMIDTSGSFSMVNGGNATYTANRLQLDAGSNLTFDWQGGGVDRINSTLQANTATTPGNVGISINPTNPSGTNLVLIGSTNGGLLTSGTTNYMLANNTNFTATITQSDTQVLIGSFANANALTSAYWKGSQVIGAMGSMAFSSGTLSNWASDASGTSAGGVVPGTAANVFFSTTTGATQQANVVLGNSMMVNSVTFDDTTPVTILSDGNYLTLYSSGTGTASAISANQNATINANVVLATQQTWTAANNRTLAVGGSVLGPSTSSLTKDGLGTIIHSGTNTYLGATHVLAGTLLVNGDSSAATGDVTVYSGGTLGGTGIVGGATTILAGGMLSPGASIGMLTIDDNLDIIGGVTAVNSQSLIFELGTNPSSDRVTLTGTNLLSIGTGLLEFDDFVFSGAPTAGTYTLFDTGIDVFGTLGANLSGTIGGYLGTLAFADGGNDIILTLENQEPSAIPEPGTFALAALGLLGLGVFAWRRRKTSPAWR